MFQPKKIKTESKIIIKIKLSILMKKNDFMTKKII
jgi:hypothetical protein